MDKEVDRLEGGTLAQLWKQVIFDNKLESLLKYYLDRYKLRGGKRSKTTIQGYFTAPSITWKTLLFLLFKILPVRKLRVTLELTMVDDSISSHTLSITPTAVKDLEEEEIEKKIKGIVNE